ncbi:hypothetical protein [Nocardioides acrostichi]|uniref:Uncharacterized protein n=1 Tax=Nocardioides acrostichi TaxID=2784339 RepID=A0A930V1Q5_9ACTN|nr:hypothetical protein [Nocardioides acrostichi]MBF4161614.1 hypothetical protein [Nocardioides acrostichi]
MNDADSIVFDQVQIGRGLKPVAQHGFVVLTPGHVTLLDSKEQQVATGPISGCNPTFTRFTRKQNITLLVGGETFNVAPAWGRTVGTLLPDGKGVKDAAALLMACLENDGRLPA